jgi:DNA-binding transcriptional LysR family regulator
MEPQKRGGSVVFDWNDLKPFLAVAREGSTIAAARALGIDQSTVQRRLCALERAIGHRLVRRLSTGYRLTDFGQRLLPEAQRVETAALALQQRVDAFRCDLDGVVRVTCPEPLVGRIVNTGLLDSFRARYPGIEVQFVVSDKQLDLQRGEADVALRVGDTLHDTLVGRRIGETPWAVYASRAYIAQRGRPDSIDDLQRHALIGFDESLSKHHAMQWLRTVVPNARFVAQIESILGLLRATRAGIGVAALPVPLGDSEPDLVQVLGPVRALSTPWRVLTTHELRHTPRVAAFFDFIVEQAETLQPLLAGAAKS